MVLVDTHFIRNSEFSTQASLNHNDRYLVAVADGMGGHNRGDVASNDVLRNLQYYFSDIPEKLNAGDFNEVMVEWLDSINNFVASKGRADEQFKGMGTTLVGLAYYYGDFYSMNCGDSRLYRFRQGELTQLTTDHSLNNMLGSEKHTNIITNCIGGGCNSSYMDLVRISDIWPDDVFLLCSDGLTDMLPDQKIARLLNDGADAMALGDAAVEAGGLDNVSCCVITIK
jgi:protein phosphatase